MSYLIIFFVIASAKSPLPFFAKEGLDLWRVKYLCSTLKLLKADNLIFIEIKNLNEPVTINLLKNSSSLAKRVGDLTELLNAHTQSALTFSKNK